MRSGVMLCYPFEESRLNKWNTKVVLQQPKLDGERCRAIYDKSCNEVVLYSSEQNVITSVPHIEEALQTWLKRTPVNKVELDGELYTHGTEFEDIHSIVSRKVNQHFQSDTMQYHVFDIINGEPQLQRAVTLSRMYLLNLNPSIKLVQMYPVTNVTEIMKNLEMFKKDGYEGFIIRHPNALYIRKRATTMMKFKPRKEDIYTVVGFIEEVSIKGEPKGRLGAFICQGDDGTKFNVGTGFDDASRLAFWQMREDIVREGLSVRVKYQALTKYHVPRFPVYVELMPPVKRPIGDL